MLKEEEKDILDAFFKKKLFYCHSRKGRRNKLALLFEWKGSSPFNIHVHPKGVNRLKYVFVTFKNWILRILLLNLKENQDASS